MCRCAVAAFLWGVVCGVWCVVCGVWCVVCGVWCVVCGVWCVRWWLCGVCGGGCVCDGVVWCVWLCVMGTGLTRSYEPLRRASLCTLSLPPSRTQGYNGPEGTVVPPGCSLLGVPGAVGEGDRAPRGIPVTHSQRLSSIRSAVAGL